MRSHPRPLLKKLHAIAIIGLCAYIVQAVIFQPANSLHMLDHRPAHTRIPSNTRPTDGSALEPSTLQTQ